MIRINADRPAVLSPLAIRIVSRIRSDAPLAVLDAALACGAYVAALALRFDGAVPARFWHSFVRILPLLIGVHLIVNMVFGLYGRVWRYASIQEARRIAAAFSASLPVLLVADLLADRALPLSVLILGFTLSLAGFAAVRFQARLFGLRRREALGRGDAVVLVVGAGDAGARIVRDMLSDQTAGMRPRGFVDDDPRKIGLTIHGVPVLCGLDELAEAIEKTQANQVLVAIPHAEAELYGRVLTVCERAEIPMMVLPKFDEVVGGRPAGVRDFRELRIEDLIGRRQIETDMEAVRELLAGKRVLVTGAGGSIGQEIARQVASFDPAALILLEHDETHLHDLLTDLSMPNGQIVPLLADIRDLNRLLQLIVRAQPDVVFHAAAHKHVPLLEEHPEEAIKTNILGSANVGEAVLAAGAERFILISTDKAIHPVSVMGASKLMAEQVVRSLNGRGCRFSAVRFGNVVGSRGSVIPTFVRQIAHGGPVTVTHPEMTRYFMSIAEAVQLVLQAAAMSEGGEVFTLDMGEPVNIMDLARRMIRLSGKTTREIPIEVTGMRAGERLTEPIISPEESFGWSVHPHIFRSVPPELNEATMRATLRELSKLCDAAQSHVIRSRLTDLASAGVEIDLTRRVVTLTGADITMEKP